jgi:hypothetical protein
VTSPGPPTFDGLLPAALALFPGASRLGNDAEVPSDLKECMPIRFRAIGFNTSEGWPRLSPKMSPTTCSLAVTGAFLEQHVRRRPASVERQASGPTAEESGVKATMTPLPANGLNSEKPLLLRYQSLENTFPCRDLPPRVAQAFVRDMRAFFKAKNQLKQDDAQLHALWVFQRLARRSCGSRT